MKQFIDLGGWVHLPREIERIQEMQPHPTMKIARGMYGLQAKRETTLLYMNVVKLLGQYNCRVQVIGDCFIKDTKVLMSTGELKNIQDIKEGEYVITHKNRSQKVLRTIKKDYSGKLLTIKAHGHEDAIICTPDHQFITYKYDRHNFKSEKFNWESAQDLNGLKHVLLYPYGLNEDFKNRYINYNGKQISINEDFAYFIGLYLAEGGCSKNNKKSKKYHKITFNLCIDEENLADKIINITNKIFNVNPVKYYHKKDQNVLLVEIHNTELATWLKTLIPGNIYTKEIPKQILISPKNVKMECLRGWLDGDGCKYKSCVRVSGISVSYNLIRDMYILSSSIGLDGRVLKRKKYPHQNVAAKEINFYGWSANQIYPTSFIPRKQRTHHTSLGIARQIKSISQNNVENIEVFCLEVEKDNSFIANGCAVHNCVSFGAAGAVDVLKATQIILGNSAQWIAETATEPIYALSRVEIGGGQLSGQDGSAGAWAAQALAQIGSLVRQKYGQYDLTIYSGDRAKQWGETGLPNELEPVAHEHLVKSTTLVSSVEDTIAAITNGYPVTIASNQGFQNIRNKDGFSFPESQWAHQMLIHGYRTDIEGFCIQNSWPISWISGPLVLNQPEGSFWITAEVLHDIFNSGAADCWAFSNFEGYPPQEMDMGII